MLTHEQRKKLAWLRYRNFDQHKQDPSGIKEAKMSMIGRRIWEDQKFLLDLIVNLGPATLNAVQMAKIEKLKEQNEEEYSRNNPDEKGQGEIERNIFDWTNKQYFADEKFLLSVVDELTENRYVREKPDLPPEADPETGTPRARALEDEIPA